MKPVMQRIVEDGHEDVTIVPLFMTENMYTRTIPQAMGLRGAGTEGVFEYGGRELRYRMTPPVGDSPQCAQLVADIADEFENCGILLVSKCSDKGETDPIIASSMKIIEERGHPVGWCQNTKDPKPGAKVIESLRAKGAESVVAIPVAIGASVRFQLDGMRVAGSLGSDPRMADVIAAMIERP